MTAGAALWGFSGPRPAAVLAFVLSVLSACAPRVEAPGQVIQPAALTTSAVVTSDGAHLPLRRWTPESGAGDRVVVAVHGFNDYSRFFDSAGTYLAERGITTYAYDQRGFGAAPNHGLWAGLDAYVHDLAVTARLVRAEHPGARLIILGESMGGAFAMTAAARGLLDADGLILAAPAVWGRAAMPWYQKAALWLSAHTVPWLPVTGRGLNRRPSDNIAMLRAMGQDPLVIKETRIDSVFGLVGAMDAALAAAGAVRLPTLMLYGQRDEIVPESPSLRAARDMTRANPESARFAVYETGYHMLLRDLQAETVWRDLQAWIDDPNAPLPSGAIEAGRAALQTFDARTNATAGSAH